MPASTTHTRGFRPSDLAPDIRALFHVPAAARTALAPPLGIPAVGSHIARMGEDTSERSERAAHSQITTSDSPLDRLTEKQRSFAEAVALRSESQTQASKSAGYKVKDHTSNGGKLAHQPHVRAAIAALRAEALRTGGYTLARAVAEVREFAARAADDKAWTSVVALMRLAAEAAGHVAQGAPRADNRVAIRVQTPAELAPDHSASFAKLRALNAAQGNDDLDARD